LADGRQGRSGVLVLRGEPGIGKTALLELAVESAAGFRVLRARGVESESEIAFAGLQELFGPVIDRLRRLPERQRAVLAGALALGPPVLGDPLAVRVAALSMLAAAAEDGPLLAVIDDAHWLDPPSAEALAFGLRRLHSEGVVVLVAMREAEPSAFDPTGLRVLEVRGLAEEPARALVADRAGNEISTAVADRLVEVAEGNPLALRELPGTLTAAQLVGREPLQEPLAVGGALESAFARRLRLLPTTTREALLVVAASGQDQPVAAALRARGLGEAAFAPAEQAGVVTIADGSVRFRHPLMRSVVYKTASAERRRMAHTALAGAADETADGRAWHLAAAAAGPDERVAAALDDAAARASARGGLSTAARTFERAARLSAATDARCRRLLAAADHAYASGQPDWASSLVTDGLPLAATAPIRADYRYLAAAVEPMRGSSLRARELLWRGAEDVASDDPARAAMMFYDAVVTDMMRGDLRAAAASADRGRRLAATCSASVQLMAELVGAMPAIDRGEVCADEVDMLETASAPDLPPTAAITMELTRAAWCAQRRERGDAARENELDRAIAAARDRGAIGPLPYLLGFGAWLDYREGRWTRAAARASEASELASDTGQGNARAWALVNLAQIEAGQGREGDCREHAAQARELAEALDMGSLKIFLPALLGLLELGLGNVWSAVERLEQCARNAATAGLAHPYVVPYEPDLVEALSAASRVPEARAAAGVLEQRAQRMRSPWGLATAARCRGLLATEDEFGREFQAALTLHERVPSAFERARTELCYGERLHRARQRSEARERLSSALATFEQLESGPWAERARRELQATGITARPRRDPTAVDRLTSREVRVALIIAEGASVREAAAQLFLSPKTIEAHLGRAYRKLGVHNRAQLATTFARRQPPAA